MPKHSKLPVEERVEPVLALLRKEKTAAVLARRNQVSEQTLYRWRDEYMEGGRNRLAKKEAGAGEESRVSASSRRSWIDERRRSES